MRTATPTSDLGQLRRLPRQAMHRTGASPRTIKTAPFLDPTDALLAARSFLCQFFPAGVATSFIGLHLFAYALLTCASRIRRKALKYTAVYGLRESSLLQSVLCGVHTAPCWSSCTPLVCASTVGFLFEVLTFSNGHVIWEK